MVAVSPIFSATTRSLRARQEASDEWRVRLASKLFGVASPEPRTAPRRYQCASASASASVHGSDRPNGHLEDTLNLVTRNSLLVTRNPLAGVPKRPTGTSEREHHFPNATLHVSRFTLQATLDMGALTTTDARGRRRSR